MPTVLHHGYLLSLVAGNLERENFLLVNIDHHPDDYWDMHM